MRGAGARLDGPRARARHHDQGAGGAGPLHGPRRQDLQAAPDRHPRATSTSTTRCRARSPPARARCWWSTRPRASRRRRVANTYLAVDAGLELVPVMNKIDLPSAEPERVAHEIGELIGEQPDEHPADLGQDGRGGGGRAGGDRAARSRRRRATPTAPPRALIFDSVFDQYRGVVAYVRVVDGDFRAARRSARCRPARAPRSTTSASSRPTW